MTMKQSASFLSWLLSAVALGFCIATCLMYTGIASGNWREPCEMAICLAVVSLAVGWQVDH
jgi:hypothetical protein